MAEKKHTLQYHKNFVKAVFQVMADRPEELPNHSRVAEFIGVHKVTMYKIMDMNQAPTVEQGITLCLKGGFNANWMFLNKGDLKYQDQITLNEIAKRLKV